MILQRGFLRQIAKTQTRRSMSFFTFPEGQNFASVDKNELKKLMEDSKTTNDRSFYLFDVREPSEIQMTGVVAHAGINAINIPLNKVADTLSTDEADFLSVYGVSKPNKVNDLLLFTCRSGKRSATASDIARSMNFENVANYTGGALDWFNDT